MNSAAAARCGCDPAEGVFFGCLWAEGGPPFVGTWGEGEPRGANSFARAPCREAFAEERVSARGKFFRSCAVSGGLRRGACSRVGQILSPVRRVGRLLLRRAFSRGQIPSPSCRVGRPSPRGVFLRGANPFARALCREAFAEESVLAWGKSFRSCAVSGGFRRGACSCAGQILSLVRRVGRLSPRGRVPARDKSFRSCAVSGCFRRGEPSRAGQILLLVRRFGRPSPRGVFLRG